MFKVLTGMEEVILLLLYMYGQMTDVSQSMWNKVN